MSEYEVVTDEQTRLAAFGLRYRVFVDEQDVPPNMETDDLDKDAIHVVAKQNGTVVGTGRLVIEGKTGHIGRLAVEKDKRGQNIGLGLMKKPEEMAQKQGLNDIYLHAQVQAEGFYLMQGYKPQGDIFDDAGIPHIKMAKTLTTTV